MENRSPGLPMFPDCYVETCYMKKSKLDLALHHPAPTTYRRPQHRPWYEYNLLPNYPELLLHLHPQALSAPYYQRRRPGTNFLQFSFPAILIQYFHSSIYIQNCLQPPADNLSAFRNLFSQLLYSLPSLYKIVVWVVHKYDNDW